jgi:hypothetical protein
MDLRDLIVTPIFVIIIYALAYLIRPLLTDRVNRKYFFPALTLKLIGAVALGFVYQFYYHGGDTFNYHTNGSRVIWETLLESPGDALYIFFNPGKFGPGLWEVSDKIWYWRDPQSFGIVRIATVFDLITFSTYSSTAICFAFVSFIGIWYFFLTFYQLFPHLHKWLAIGAFFIPSVFFWGSGILKDTITMACLGIATFEIKRIFIDKKFSSLHTISLIGSVFILFTIKKYVLTCFIPAALFWVYAGNLFKIKSWAARLTLLPLILTVTFLTGFYVLQKFTQDDPRYALDKIAETARVTAYDIRYWSGKDAGSGYSLGELDGSFGSMLKLAPNAVNVALFRPYVWEARNLLMLISSAEAMFLLFFTLFLLIAKPLNFIKVFADPNILFCFVFSITFAFAVGVSTYNFGTLARYKIPMLPFYFIGLVLVKDKMRQVQS